MKPCDDSKSRVLSALCAACVLLAAPFVLTSPALAGSAESGASEEGAAPPARERVAADEEESVTLVAPPDKERERPAKRGASLTESLQGEGGVSIQTMCTNCNSADLSMGGLSNAHIEMSCDGLPVPPGLAQIYLLSILPSTVIHDVQISKGAGQAALNGGAVGGAIDVERRRPERAFGLAASADVGSFGWRAARADVEARFGRFGLNVTGSMAESDLVFADDDDVPDSPEIDRETVDARAWFELAEGQELRAGVSRYDEDQFEGRAAFDQSFGTWNLENVDLTLEQYDLAYEGRYRDGSQLMVGGAFSRREALIEETIPATLPLPEREYFPAYDIEDERRFASARYARPLGLRAYLRGGASWEEREMAVVDVRKNLFDIFSGLPMDQVFTRAQGERIVERGVWAEADVQLGRALELVVGARWVDFDYEDSFAATYEFASATVRDAWAALPLPEGSRVLPRAALHYKPSEAWTLNLTTGAGFRLPEPTYEEVCCGRRFRGNRGLDTEKSWSSGLEAVYQPDPDVQVTASAFLTEFDDLVVKLIGLSNRYQPTYQNANVPSARYLSLGLQARAALTSWLELKGSLTWLDAKNTSEGDVIPFIILNFSNLPEARTLTSAEIPYVAETSGTLGAQVTLPGWGLRVSLDAQYQGAMLIQTFEPGGIEDALGFRETESFFITNLRLAQPIGRGLELFAGVDNLEDYVQEDLADPRSDYTWGPLRGRYYYGGISYRLGD